MDRRKKCPSCGNILAHSAYQRHIADHTGSVCAGKLSQGETQRKKESSSEESDIFSTDQDSDGDSNSSFDFESSTESCEAIPEMDIEDSDVNLESSICDKIHKILHLVRKCGILQKVKTKAALGKEMLYILK